MSRFGKPHSGNFPLAVPQPPQQPTEQTPHVVPPLVPETFQQQTVIATTQMKAAAAGVVDSIPTAAWLAGGLLVFWIASNGFARLQ